MGEEEYASEGKNRRKKIERFNGLLGIELFGAEFFFQAAKKAKSEHIAQYFAAVVEELQLKGYARVDIFLDRNATHKTKMQTIFRELTQHLTIQTTFHLMAAYSPKLNLVEYAIHLIRQKVLHHADHKTSLAQFEQAIKEQCDKGNILNKDQIINILDHIDALVPNL